MAHKLNISVHVGWFANVKEVSSRGEFQVSILSFRFSGERKKYVLIVFFK